MSDPLRELSDRQEIATLLARYTSAIDTRDWAKLARCFTRDATAEYGVPGGRCADFAAIERLCRRSLEPLDTSQHLVGSIEIDLEGDAARSRCALTAQHTRHDAPGGANFTLGGFYRDRLARTADGWRIVHRVLEVAWTDGNPAVVGPRS